MSRIVRLSDQANQDLEKIALELSEESPKSATSVLERLRETFLLLAQFPEMGTAREDLAPNVRMFTPRKPASNYVVFFYPLSNGVENSDVIHGSRDWLDLFRSGRRPIG